ncbi:PAS domain-containing protein [Croceibacterium sp. TMG7-5b_MA50]|uniref:PAS domain-containing protein n=1 Tax=Croceibacterium sp. TMG7-5b_MA50 TaxID=3121290 RepID=UPI003221401E
MDSADEIAALRQQLAATQGILRETRVRERLLTQSWAQAVWETDAEGVVVSDSPSWRAYTGQTLEQWLGYGWLDAVHPDDRIYAERQWQHAASSTPNFAFVPPTVGGAGPTSAPRLCSTPMAASRNGRG